MKGTQKGIKVKVDNIFDEFHTYSVDWNANRLKFYIDDKETFSYYKESDAQEACAETPPVIKKTTLSPGLPSDKT